MADLSRTARLLAFLALCYLWAWANDDTDNRAMCANTTKEQCK